MQSYKLRITFSQSGTPADAYALVQNYSHEYMFVTEGGDPDGKVKLHSHAFIRTDKKQPAMRAAIRKLFGPKSYSLALLDEEYPLEYLAYCLKEDHSPRHNLPSEILSKALEHDTLVKSQMKEKKALKGKIVDNIALLLTDYNKLEDHKTCAKYVATTVIRYYLDNDLLIRRHHLECLTQTLLCRLPGLMGDIYRSHLAESIALNCDTYLKK